MIAAPTASRVATTSTASDDAAAAWSSTTLARRAPGLRRARRSSASSIASRWRSSRAISCTACSSAFLKQVGDEWHANRLNIAQEHLLSGAVRSLLGAMVRLYSKEDVPRRLLFATPSGERHEFGILAAAMLAAAGGLGVVYVGADVPAQAHRRLGRAQRRRRGRARRHLFRFDPGVSQAGGLHRRSPAGASRILGGWCRCRPTSAARSPDVRSSASDGFRARSSGELVRIRRPAELQMQ